MTTKQKIIHILSYLTLTAALILIGIYTYWSVYPYDPLTINKEPFEIVNKEVVRGGSVEYVVDYCKNDDRSVVITNKFVDGVIFSTPDTRASNPAGCRKITVSLEVPHSLPPGEYYISVDYTYQVNPIREVNVKTRTESFSIIR